MKYTLLPLFVLAACKPSAPEATADSEPAPEFPALPSDPAEPRTNLPEYEVTTATPTIDGDLADWDSIPWGGALVGAGDGTAAPNSPVAGSFKFAWDADNLYLAIAVADAEASSPLERDAVDPHVWEAASGVELMLQPGDPGDNSHYYEVQVCTAEAVWDTQFDDYNRPITGDGAEREFGHQSWDAALIRETTVFPGEGYIVEMALPWSTIDSPNAASPPTVDAIWRANVYSFRDGQRHSLAWSPLLGQGNFHRSSRFGRLTFR